MNEHQSVDPRMVAADQADRDEWIDGVVADAVEQAAMQSLITTTRARAIVWTVAALAAWLSFFASAWLFQLGRTNNTVVMVAWLLLATFLMLVAPKGAQ